MGLVFAVVVVITTAVACVAWLLEPEWRGRRIFTRWLYATIATMLVFIFVELFVHPATLNK